jgi:hypothetical protein
MKALLRKAVSSCRGKVGGRVCVFVTRGGDGDSTVIAQLPNLHLQAVKLLWLTLFGLLEI